MTASETAAAKTSVQLKNIHRSNEEVVTKPTKEADNLIVDTPVRINCLTVIHQQLDIKEKLLMVMITTFWRNVHSTR